MDLDRLIKSKYLVWLFALTVNNWILSVIFNRNLLLKRGSISDFSALSQPYHYIFRSLDILSGVLIIIISLALLKWHSRSRLGKAISLGALLFGIANIVDALIPLPCTNIIDKGCSVPLTLNVNHLVLPRHIYSSAAIGFCILFLPLAGWIYARKLTNTKLKLISALALTTAFLFVVFLMVGSFSNNHFIDDSASYMQYTQMVVLGWWYIEWTRIYADKPDPAD